MKILGTCFLMIWFVSKKGYITSVQIKDLTLVIISYERTSDSLNEGLPIKMAREMFQRKCYFFHVKDSRFNSRIIRKSVLSLDKCQLKNMG